VVIDLAAIIEAWHRIPAAVKARIMGIIEGVIG
jgi:hypothetical protein